MLSDEELRAALPRYDDVLAAQATSRKNAAALVELDRWYRDELLGRAQDTLTKEELTKIMRWKLSRGKWRPRLETLVTTNTEEAVKTATASSSGLLAQAHPLEALKALAELKAVGPATASAILALQAPKTQAFMSDECMEAVGAAREYTVKAWEAFTALVEKRLPAWEGGAEEFERACYAAVAGKRLGVLDTQEAERSETDERPRKKRKKA